MWDRHHRILLEQGLDIQVATVADLGRCSLCALHCGNDDDTIGTTRTVDGGCRGVFQNVHRLDVARVDVRQLAHKGNTVEHNQRVVAGRQRALATDANLHLLARLRAGLRHQHTCYAALQSLGGIRGSNLIEFLAADVGHRTGDSLAALSTVTDDHHIVQRGVVLAQNDVDVLTAVHCHTLAYEAHVRHFQLSIPIGGDVELTVDVGNAARLRSNNPD